MNSNPTLSVLILIPARYHSTRFPGKPLVTIAGKSMLRRVWDIALTASDTIEKLGLALVDTIVLTEDTRIQQYCEQESMKVLMTSDSCNSGTERAAEALNTLDSNADLVINLQGDNALCPPWFLTDLVRAYTTHPQAHVITPYVRLDWPALDELRKAKSITPFSGTTVVYNQKKEALWFSKQILPAIRNEVKLRNQQNDNPYGSYSPVSRHIGLYAYQKQTLLDFSSLKQSNYEPYEGLEQLAFLEEGLTVQLVEVDYKGRHGMSGIDSPEDVDRAERVIAIDGELTE